LLTYCQEGEVTQLLAQATDSINMTICLKSMHAAVLQPRRLVAWFEGALKMQDYGLPDLKIPELLSQRCPGLDGYAQQGAPGLVSAAQWKEGAVQLRREVSHC
jgi:hypothetical protein